MPLSAELEALLGTMTDATKREATRKELEEGNLRQQDYSRKMNELQAKQKEWTTWHSDADKKFRDAMAERDNLKARVSELETMRKSGQTDDLFNSDDEAAVEKALKQARSELGAAQEKIGKLETAVTDVKRQFDEGKLITAEKFDEEVTRRGDALGAAMFDIIDKQSKYRSEFGKELDRNSLIMEAQKRGGDITAAYDFLTQKDREEKLRKDIETEYEKKYTERLKSANLPVDQGGGEPVLGPLQSRLQKKETGIPEDVVADGSGRLATLIAQELRAEGKS
jgi:chromosome segregation ATPase